MKEGRAMSFYGLSVGGCSVTLVDVEAVEGEVNGEEGHKVVSQNLRDDGRGGDHGDARVSMDNGFMGKGEILQGEAVDKGPLHGHS